MTDRPLWMDYIDLGTKVAVPVAVVVATLLFNDAAENRRSLEAKAEKVARQRQECFDNQFKLTSAVCQDENCTVTGRRATSLVQLSSVTGEMCGAAGVKISPVLAEDVSTSIARTGDADKAGAAAVSLGLAPARVETPAAQVQVAPPRSDPRPVTLNPRIYIQTAERSQDAAVEALKTRLAESQFDGKGLVGLGPDLVPSRVSRTQLRCMRAADCKDVARMAAYLSLLLDTTVAPVDLSARYERSTNSRPGHYELWLAPGPLEVQQRQP